MEWLILLLAIVVGIPAIFWVGQERLIFFPQAIVSTDHLGAGIAPIEIVSADGTRLHGWIRAANAAPAPVVLYFGGNAEEVSWTIAERRWPTGWTIAARSDVDAKHIVAFGRSLGTGVAVKLAAARPLAGAVLASPYKSLVALGRTHYPWLPVSWLLKHRFDVESDARRTRIPMIAIVASNDAIIPRVRSQALYDAWGGPKAWIDVPATDHNTLAVPDSFWTAVAQFLAER